MRAWPGMILLAAVAVGCRYRPEPVPLSGAPEELRPMVGHWVGRYTGLESGRVGTIDFTVNARADSAYGEVLLTVPGSDDPVFAIDPVDVHMRHATSLQSLSISFVGISGGRVRGTLEPYRAPDCGCVARTVFTGTVTGNTITGTFITTLEDGHQQQGTWRVTRSGR